MSNCHSTKRFDKLLFGSLAIIIILYCIDFFDSDSDYISPWLHSLSHSVSTLVNTVWWGIVAGMVMIAFLSKVPRHFIIALLGRDGGFRAIIRATLAGVLLDLCNHGILMVGAKLYERGATIGQVMAFLVASPWNSFSLTLILIALVGIKWTLLFIAFSVIIALITGLIFDHLSHHNFLPSNPHRIAIPEDFHFWNAAWEGIRNTHYNKEYFISLLKDGLKESRMVLRWTLFGIVLAGIIQATIATDILQHYFGPTLAGLGFTLLAATIIEVCSEGSTPIAADLLHRAQAPGNGFAFLMGGVATDYTEIMVIKETTASWKIAIYLPLVTIPQILLLSWLINQVGV